MSRSFIQNCRWVTASFTSSSMKDLCQKWKVKLIFRGAWNSLMVWPDWPCPDPYILRQINGTGCTLPLVRFHSCDFVFRALSHRSRCQYTITSFSVSNWESSKPSTVAVILHPAEGLMSRTLTSLNRSTASEHWRCVFFTRDWMLSRQVTNIRCTEVQTVTTIVKLVHDVVQLNVKRHFDDVQHCSTQADRRRVCWCLKIYHKIAFVISFTKLSRLLYSLAPTIEQTLQIFFASRKNVSKHYYGPGPTSRGH